MSVWSSICGGSSPGIPYQFSAMTPSGAGRTERERHSRLPLDQLDDVREVALPEPGTDGRDQRLGDLRRDGHGDTPFARDVEQQTSVLCRERERELRRPPALVDAL